MRITIALSLLVTLCIVEAFPSTDLEILRIQVRNMKWNIETVIRELELLRIQAEEDTLRQVSLKGNEEQDSYREYKTLLLSDIRKETNAAKEAGKNVDSCYEEAVEGIENHEKEGDNGAKKCEYVAKDSIHNDLGFIDNLMSTGRVLSIELDRVFLNCHDSDIYRMQSCIISELAKLDGSLKSLESDSITAKITIVPVSKNVIMQASNCIKQVYSNIRSAADTIRMGVTRCIKETPTTTTTTTTTTEEP